MVQCNLISLLLFETYQSGEGCKEFPRHSYAMKRSWRPLSSIGEHCRGEMFCTILNRQQIDRSWVLLLEMLGKQHEGWSYLKCKNRWQHDQKWFHNIVIHVFSIQTLFPVFSCWVVKMWDTTLAQLFWVSSQNQSTQIIQVASDLIWDDSNHRWS